jgi:Tol biopolymer transport system component
VAAAAAGAGVFQAGFTRGRGRPPGPKPGPQLVQLTWETGFEASPSVSPDGGSFVYDAGPHGQRDVFLRRVGGENPVNLTKDFAGNDRQPAFSPDGTKIAFQSDREGGGIFLMGATGESPRRLADLGYDPAWSPDGKKIVFATGQHLPDSNAPSELWVVDVSEGTRRRLYDDDGMQPTWSPTGSRVAFHQGRRQGQLLGARLSISTIPAAGGAPTVALELEDTWRRQPEWTRSGILFNTSAGGVLNVWKLEVDESTGEALDEPRPVLVSPTRSSNASSTPDGRRMLFEAWTGGYLIERLDFDPVGGILSGTRGVVLSDPRDLRPVDLSPDGEWLAAVLLDEKGRKEVALVRVRTGETRRLTDDPVEKDHLLWAPDGSRLYFGVAPEGATEVWSIRPDGSGRRREFRPADGRQVLANLAAPDGRTLHVLVGKEQEPYTIDLSAPVENRRLEPLPPPPDGRRFVPAALSPDGRWLAGMSRAADGTGERPPLLLLDVVEKTYEVLLDSTASVRGWLPDSRRLLLCQREGPCQVLDRVTRRISPAGTIGERTFWLLSPWLSRDGRSLFGSRFGGQGDIWMLEYGEALARQ